MAMAKRDHVVGRPRQVQICRGKSGLHGTRCRVTPGGSGKPGSGTVPQRRDRRWLWQQRTGKGETVRQERTARWATKAARQTPPGARPNRDGAHVSTCRAGTGPVIRVGCWRRRVTAVREEWSPRGANPGQNPAYRRRDRIAAQPVTRSAAMPPPRRARTDTTAPAPPAPAPHPTRHRDQAATAHRRAPW